MVKKDINSKYSTNQKSPLRGAGGLSEIFSSLKHNKLRTALTGFAVAWGIFILIVLLSAGNGLRNGIESTFSGRMTNSVQIYSAVTSIPYKGLKVGRSTAFSEKELDVVAAMPETGGLTGIITIDQIVSFGAEYGAYSMRGVQPAYEQILNLDVQKGRFINDLDEQRQNKVVVLDNLVERTLFKGECALGKFVKIGSLMFRVVGVNTLRYESNGRANVYIPFSTAQAIFNSNKKFYRITFAVHGLETVEENEAFNQRLKTNLAKSMNFDPNDPRAIPIWNRQKDYIETQKIFGAINIFVAIIGIFTLIAGVVGISNIMLVSVKERTREFGIRKAIGAPPRSILWSVILEAVIITAIFGYIGLVLGVGVTELANTLLQQNTNPNGMTIFKNPTIGIGYAFAATGIMIIAGVIAGYIPARRAVKIKPIEAMREE